MKQSLAGKGQQTRLIPIVGLVGLAMANPAIARDQLPQTLTAQAEDVAARLEGVMDTAAQAQVNPTAPNVTMTTCRIAVRSPTLHSPTSAIFLYQEQSMSKDLAKPYRQRFLQISPSPISQSVRSLSFKPANPARWSGFCNQSQTERVIQANDLGMPVCSVFIRRSGIVFVGSTPVDGCPANVRGAVRITNQIVLHQTGMDTWDRGFDAQGKQVWGAKTESYQFRRR